MVEHNNERFYTCTEIARMLNENKEEVIGLKAKVKEVYKNKDDYCFTDQYWQLRLYKACKKGSIRYITFLKNKNQRKCYAFSINDVCNWLGTDDALHPFKKLISDIEIHEPVTGTNCITA